ncbi:MAG: 30S ribosomal protein S20 [Chloroflexi bacterium]|jgi:small subunit ribosomal protein S20|nr:30S ribosomal protein S20 [Chloroflexota bacterium]
MANIKSQIKRNRQNEKRRLANRIVRGSTRTAIAKARVALAGENEDSKELVLKAIKALDKAAQKGVLHKNNSARKKSRLMKKLAMIEQK